ncbi:MAG: hypothetical protein KKD07_04745 [Candidatus Omnitrophica bacterium]|nr:hypothetical protein [Candidatus Omnitrophota bacterium]MBU1995980.1 hypothetical protein [Candidatus Omnitrophota bacterium]MBU4333731.1 hypothetical protein [Candidatus Omnitrophota bacterium]
MTKSEISRLIKQGKLKEQVVGIIQVEELLKQSILDLQEAKKTLDVSDSATYILAYMAVLKAGRAFLAFKGYRPIDGAQHKTVVETMGLFLGEDFEGLVLHFETMRRKRNEMTYEAGGLVSHSEAKKAFDDAIMLIKGVLAEVKHSNPQIKLEF